jgi:hypothetical protein
MHMRLLALTNKRKGHKKFPQNEVAIGKLLVLPFAGTHPSIKNVVAIFELRIVANEESA